MTSFYQDMQIALCRLDPNLCTPRITTLLARELGLQTGAHLLCKLVDETDVPERLCRWPTQPQTKDPSFVKALRLRSPELAKDLTKLSGFWPMNYIAAHYQVSQHWIGAAQLLFGIRPYCSRVPTIKPARESEFMLLPITTQEQELNLAMQRFHSVTAAAISLGVTPEFYRNRVWALGLQRTTQNTKELREPPPTQGQDPLMLSSTKVRRRLTAKVAEQVRATFDQYRSITEYCEATGVTRAKAYHWAKRAAWPGLRQTHKQTIQALAQKILDTNPPEPQTLTWWVMTLYPDVDHPTQWYQKQTRLALHEAGLSPSCQGYANWVWVAE